jgi:hypothetical protein
MRGIILPGRAGLSGYPIDAVRSGPLRPLDQPGHPRLTAARDVAAAAS